MNVLEMEDHSNVSTIASATITFPDELMSGAELIARSIEEIANKDAVVMGVPGSPITEIIDWLENNSCKKGMAGWIDFGEVNMVRQLIGANSHGRQTIAVMKHTGFFKIQELISTMTNHDLNAPMVLIIGDEPGAGSQNGNDSRFLCDSSYLPIVEPSFQNIPDCFFYCLDLSARLRKPVVLRVVPALTDTLRCLNDCTRHFSPSLMRCQSSYRDYYASEALVIGRYLRTKSLLHRLRLGDYKPGPLNQIFQKNSKKLVVAAGATADRVKDIISELDEIDLLEINTVNGFPQDIVKNTFDRYESVLILESWEPYLEQHIRGLCQQLQVRDIRVFGREQGVDGLSDNAYLAGDYSEENIAQILISFQDHDVPKNLARLPCVNHAFANTDDHRYPYIFESFSKAAQFYGKTPVFSVSTGRTRYAVMNTPYEKFVKFMGPMGSETMTLVGYLDYAPVKEELAACLVIGDYTFLHSSWSGLSLLNKRRIERKGKIPTILIKNGGSLTTGGQLCAPPEETGSKLVVNWKKRYLGSVSVENISAMEESMKILINNNTPEDILVVSMIDLPTLEKFH